MTELYSHGYEEEVPEEQWRAIQEAEAQYYNWMQQETLDTAAADEASARRADEGDAGRCPDCHQSLADIAASKSTCSMCFFHFDPTQLGDALRSVAFAAEPGR